MDKTFRATLPYPNHKHQDLNLMAYAVNMENKLKREVRQARLEALNDAMVALGTKKVFGGASGGGDTVIVPLGKPTLASKNAQAIIQSLIDKEEQ